MEEAADDEMECVDKAVLVQEHNYNCQPPLGECSMLLTSLINNCYRTPLEWLTTEILTLQSVCYLI